MRDERFVLEVEDARPSAWLQRPDDADLLLVLAHGAGAGMEHPFMSALCDALHTRRVATLRYQFPYVEEGRRRPDPPARAMATVRAALSAAGARAADLACLAGGKSFGGRMTSSALAEQPNAAVRGVVFVGFPLHPPARPGVARAAHLRDLACPMLFVQGDRDDFAPLSRLRPVLEGLGGRATLEVVAGGDHGFAVLKRSGLDQRQVIARIASAIASFGALRR